MPKKADVFSEYQCWEVLLLGKRLHVIEPGSAGLDASPHLVSAASLWFGNKDQDESSCSHP